ncbi:UDP:flavonoid glycosyltransferase YjiC, YdhE family [Geoalkalibacter ferrihydriticus]|uniref:Glycosyl transferase family 28 C-terminal domain-containing protein n=2 Tax=Geoalkalibacter ferrihydriticus TaxID=392333 RepID=A0A0C2EAS8_9BACT|nr:hypothetical protein [Geoalkalibacter ferrihydriticus]KIH75663.1 hypothetical protein GFER_15130 [Geoalkalibacter ferrihydriticus DSM 17813]SDM72201.1 UDP:flavonoid glycosyltransferase YjiC, YdhE family [Geoalkalibacter ferrihydriticus]
MPKIRYYISGHGLGHASRSCQIINTLRRRHGDIAVEVVSDAHEWFFRSFLDPSVSLRRAQLDIGVLQLDSLRMQEAQTLTAYREFLPQRQLLAAAEAASLRAERVSLVAADIPPLALAAARQAGIPGIGIANFTWEWIYADLVARYGGFDDVLTSVREDYRQASGYLRLPFHGPFPEEVPSEELPLVARSARLSRAQVREHLALAPDQRLALISFGGFGLADFDFSALARLRDWVFVSEAGLSTEAPNILTLPPDTLAYPDLVGAADVVVTKPGYGIVSEAIVNGTAVLYTSRGAFCEQALLVAGLERYARARGISNEKLLRGDWGEDLEALLRQPLPTATLACNGDQIAADRLATLAREPGTFA